MFATCLCYATDGARARRRRVRTHSTLNAAMRRSSPLVRGLLRANLMLACCCCAVQVVTAPKRPPVTVQPYCRPADAAPPPKKGDAATKVAAVARAAAMQSSSLETSPIDVAFFDTRPSPDVASMRRAAALCNSTTHHVRFHALLKYPRVLPGFRVTLLKLPPLARCLYDGMKRLSHGPGPQYLYKPLLHHVMPREVERLILLDTDIVMVRDVRELFAEFGRFGTSVLGVGNEQSNLYGKGGEGKNGGVQLLDLNAMREEPQYDAVLDYVASGHDGRRIGYLGDQTLYSFLATDFPHLFYRLPCEWNRQISMHFGFKNETVHACPRRCGILHANYQPFKCVAKMMQASPSCSTWHAFQKRLATPATASEPCPKVQMGQRNTFRRAIGHFFADCCVEDGAGAKPFGGGRQKKLAQLYT